MKKRIPKKLKKRSSIMVISPSKSLKIVSKENINQAKDTLNRIGLNVNFSKNVYSSLLNYNCGSIEDRINDLHESFKNKNIDCILTSIGGYNCNQILKYIDYDLIKSNNKIICGFSDITALLNAIYAKTGLITYYGPHFSSFGMKQGIQYTIDYFKEACFKKCNYVLKSSEFYSDDAWYINQQKRCFIKNEGMKAINFGYCKGTIIGGNLCTFNLLQGTEFMPKDDNIILFIEDDDFSGQNFLLEFDRNLESLFQTNLGKKVKGIIIGKAQTKCNMNDEKWHQLIKSKKYLDNIPIVFDANFGHTTPIITFPIGGICEMNITKEKIFIKIYESEDSIND